MEEYSRNIEKDTISEGENGKKDREDAKIGAIALMGEARGETDQNSDLMAKANAFLRRYGRELLAGLQTKTMTMTSLALQTTMKLRILSICERTQKHIWTTLNTWNERRKVLPNII